MKKIYKWVEVGMERKKMLSCSIGKGVEMSFSGWLTIKYGNWRALSLVCLFKFRDLIKRVILLERYRRVNGFGLKKIAIF